MMGSAVLLGAYLAQGSYMVMLSPRAAFAVMLLGAAANVMNDLLDVGSDSINRPEAPLVKGSISHGLARTIFVLCAGAALVLALTLSLWQIALFTLAAILLALYNIRLKHIPLVGNLSVSFVVALSVVFGALPMDLTPTIMIASGFALMTTLARELIKDIEDVAGDRSQGARTLPIVVGRRRSIQIVRGISLVIVAGTVIPFLIAGFGGMYLLLISVTNIFLLQAYVMLSKEQFSECQVSDFLKRAMLSGMIALAFSESIPKG